MAAHSRFVLVAIALVCGACKPTLSTTPVESAQGIVRAHVPLGDGWHCDKNDGDKETFQFRGVKCVYDGGLVLNAKLYDVETNDARTADVFCIQDWKAAYKTVFSGVQTYTNNVVQWRGIPACEVVIDGSSSKGPWHLWEIHAPNGRRMFQVNVSGKADVARAQQRVIDAWVA